MRNTFNLSHDHKLSTDQGLLVPLCTMEVLPGDTFIGSASLLMRVAPLVNPVMHDVSVSVHHWWVPARTLWEDHDEWVMAKDESLVKPTVTPAVDPDDTQLLDHMGIPPKVGETYDALPVYAYNRIWNEFYRDQDLQTERDLDDLSLARVCWEKDYFTVCRPQAQMGDAVGIPITEGYLPVQVNGGSAPSATNLNVRHNGAPNQHLYESTGGDFRVNMSAGDIKIDVNDFRQAVALQRFAEARMRFGSRYSDYLRFLGVNPSTGLLDRPEYIGGGKQRVNFSEVLAMAEGATSDVGDMYGHGIAGLRSRSYKKYFEEHGWFLSLLSVRPRTAYLDHVPRKFKRFDPMDVWQKELEVLPWQEVRQSEVHVDGDPEVIFGYAQRYDEYRHEVSYVSGSFRDGPELDWHMARTFATPPTLNASFVECTPTDRIYSDTNMPELLINAHNSIKARRIIRRNAAL